MVKSIFDSSDRFIGHVTGLPGEFYARPFGTKRFFGPYPDLEMARRKVVNVEGEIRQSARDAVSPPERHGLLPL